VEIGPSDPSVPLPLLVFPIFHAPRLEIPLRVTRTTGIVGLHGAVRSGDTGEILIGGPDDSTSTVYIALVDDGRCAGTAEYSIPLGSMSPQDICSLVGGDLELEVEVEDLDSARAGVATRAVTIVLDPASSDRYCE
jgi:hypothetical protein